MCYCFVEFYADQQLELSQGLNYVFGFKSKVWKHGEENK